MILAERVLRTDAGCYRLRILLEPVDPASLGDIYHVVDVTNGRVVGMKGPEGVISKPPEGLLQVLEPVS